MIFVTVGTHEQPFNRLINKIDELKRYDFIQEDVFIQTGYSTVIPEYCDWKRMLAYEEMQKKIKDALIVITHGGPASFIAPLKEGKTPIVVPRKKEFGEHVNDHQVEFVKMVHKRQGNIIPVYNVDELWEKIRDYNQMIGIGSAYLKSNNEAFNKSLEKIVEELFLLKD